MTTSSTVTSGWTCRSASSPLRNTAHTGAPLELHNSMKTLINRMFSGEINPSQLEIVRTIRTDTTPGDIDKAVYRNSLADYDFGLTTDGMLTVTDVAAVPLDGSDRLRNIEQLQFTEGTFNLVVGTAANNTLNSTAGNDLILGMGGTDTASYAAATAGVTVSLGIAGAQNTVGAGIDALISIENLTGSAFADTLTGNTGANTLSGGAGNDTLIATVDNVRDTLNGGADTDTANYAAYAANLTVNLGAALPIIVTGSGSTGANSDVLVDIENFTGGSGNDTITGNAVANILIGGAGADTINGGAGDDTIVGGTGNDTLNGGANNDTFTYNMGDGAGSVDGGTESDTLNIVGGAAADTLDVLYNGISLTQVEGGTVVNVEAINANLGGGTDTLSYAGSASGVTVNLATPSASGFTSITSIENVTGTAQADTLTGGIVEPTLSRAVRGLTS